MAMAPAASTLTASPLRNRIRVELKAPVPDVWALVGDHTRLHEYSAGIGHVEIIDGERSEPVRVCYLRPAEGTTEGMLLREVVRWSTAGDGYATSAEPGEPVRVERGSVPRHA